MSDQDFIPSSSIGDLGYYADESALTTAHPSARDGDFARVGSTDTVWMWDSDSGSWVDTGGAAASLSNADPEPLSSAAPGSSSKAARGDHIHPRDPVVYGVKYDQANDVMTKGLIVNGSFIAVDYTSYPIQEAHVRCMRKPDGTIVGYCDPADSTKYLDGTSITFDGSEGDLQVESPAFHELWTRDGDDIYILVSWTPFEFNGAVSHVPEHFSANNVDYYYYDALENVLYDDDAGSLVDGDGNGGADTANDYLRSLPYYKPWTNEDRPDMRTLVANRTGNTHQHSWSSYQSLVALFLTKYGTWASQTELPGYTEASGWDFAYTRETGRTLSLGNADGSIEVDLAGVDSDLDGVVASGKYIANSFLGIENIFGHIWNFVDGINIDNISGNCHVYVQADPSLHADDTATDYDDTGIAPGFGDNDGYIKGVNGNQHLAPAYPTVIGGSSSTYMRDYHWNSSGAWRVLLSGGALANGARAGRVSLNATNDSSTLSAAIGARAGSF